MMDEAQLWREACEKADLNEVELEYLAVAMARDDALGPQLTFLLDHLRQDHSGAFLRAFVDLLPPYDDLDLAGAIVEMALCNALIPGPPETPTGE